MPKKVESSIEVEEIQLESEEELIEEPIKISKKTGKQVKRLSIKQLENLKLGRERGLVIKKNIAENKDITKTTAYIKEFKDKKNLKIEETNKILKEEFEEIINEKEPLRKSIKKKKKKKFIQVECSDSESESESDGIVIKKEEIIVSPIIEDTFNAERLLRQKLYNDRVTAITNFMLNKK